MKTVKVYFYSFIFLMFAISLWVVASWVDVIMNNLDPAPVYEAWNLFVLFTGGV